MILGCGLFIWAAACGGGGGGSSSSSDPATLTVSIDNVYEGVDPDTLQVLVSVTDEDGNPVPGLTSDNLVLTENGAAKALTVAAHNPVRVVILMDVTGSMMSFLAEVKEQSINFLDLLFDGDKAMATAFDNELKMTTSLLPLTQKEDLADSINSVTWESTWGSPLFDMITAAVDNISAETGNLAIIVISDGTKYGSVLPPPDDDDETSSIDLPDAIAYASGAGVKIYTIGIGSTVNTAVMQGLADGTGGEYYAAPNISQLEGIYQAIGTIFNGQYLITYSSTANTGDNVQLNITVTAAGGVTGTDNGTFTVE
jgi:VWFA-related protein